MSTKPQSQLWFKQALIDRVSHHGRRHALCRADSGSYLCPVLDLAWTLASDWDAAPARESREAEEQLRAVAVELTGRCDCVEVPCLANCECLSAARTR